MPKVDVREWLQNRVLPLIPEAQRKAIEDGLTAEKVAAVVGEDLMLRPDYSRAHDDLRKEKERLETEYREKYGYLANYLSQQQGNVKAWKEAKEKAEAKIQKLETALAKAKESGLDDDDLGLGRDGDRVPEANKKYLTEEEWQKKWEAEQIKLGHGIRDYTPALMNLAEQHRTLFPGQAIDFLELVKESSKTGRPVQEIWSEQYKVTERIAQIQQEDLDKQLQAAHEKGKREGREETLKEVASGTQMPGTPGAPPLSGPLWDMPDVKERLQAGPKNMPGDDAIVAGVEALRTGKYREQARTNR